MSSLKDLRESRGRTLRETAVLVGLSFSELARVERGERRLSGEAKLRLIRAYDLTAEEAHEIAELTAFPTEASLGRAVAEGVR